MSVLRVDLPGYAVAEPGGGPRQVLGPIAFTMEPGEVIALFGPSGCGKTTLLKLIDGLLPADGITWPDAKPRTAWVFQEPRLLPWRNVADNIALALPPGRDRSGIAVLLAALGLGDWGAAFPARLSLGMARRVAIARALAAEPALLLLDEPLASLDAEAAAGVRDLLRQRRLATVLVTHDPEDVVALATRVIVLGGSPTVVREVIAADAPGLAARLGHPAPAIGG